MKFTAQFTVAALATLASSSVVHEYKRASPLTISLESVGNTAVKAVLTNTGSEGLKLLKTGTILDEKPTEKLQIYNATGKVAFNGLKLRVGTNSLAENSFTFLGAGESKELNIDAAALHDLSEGGAFDITSAGAIPFAAVNSTQLTDAVLPFFSNKLSITVDGVEAAKVASAISLRKRSDVASDCTGTDLTATTQALSNCATLAAAAAVAAVSGSSSKFSEYFKTTSSSTRSTVAARLNAVASECGSSTSGATTTHCTDTYSACESDVLAYTLPSENYIVNCPLYFSDLSALSSTCHAQDQATTTLHEMTHADGVYSPGTDDLGYGYSAATALSATNALNNADTYALYANAIYAGC